MKKIVIFFTALIMMAACDQKPKNPVAEHGDAMINAYQKSQALRDSANLSAIKSAVQAYHSANDKYPGDLEDIKPLLNSPGLDLSKYSYDPEDGSVNLKGN
jgi:hypothetical protein